MEIYKTLSTPESKEFASLLNSQLSKTKIEEGTVVEGTVTKITDKYVFLDITGAKSEAVIPIHDLKTSNLLDKAKLKSKISVFIERLEDKKTGDLIVSADKAKKIQGFNELVRCYEANEPIMAKIISRCKGGVICKHIDTDSLLFMPGSQISDKPLKDISHLLNEPMKMSIIKLDRVRANICVSRREIVSANKAEDKAKIIAKYKVGDVIKDAVVKSWTNFGVFFDVNNGELDCLCHIMEISYSKINDPGEIFSIGQRHDVLVISIDSKKLQVGVSIRQLGRDPFENIVNYKVGSKCKVRIVKITDYGAFAEIEKGLSVLLHNSQISFTKKNASAKKLFKIGQELECIITEIDKEKRRVAVSYRDAQENPFDKLAKEVPIGEIVEGTIVNKNEYAIFVKLDNSEIEAFLHANDLDFLGNPEDNLKKFEKGQKLKCKVLEINKKEAKVRIGLKQTKIDPFSIFKDKKINDVITTIVISSNPKRIIVKPVGSELTFEIKKSELAVNSQDARPQRWVNSDKLDTAIKEINFEKRKLVLSVKLLELNANAEAIKMHGSELSGRNLPFSDLGKIVDKKK